VARTGRGCAFAVRHHEIGKCSLERVMMLRSKPCEVGNHQGGLPMLTRWNGRGLALFLAAMLLVLPVSTRSLPGLLGFLPIGASDSAAQGDGGFGAGIFGSIFGLAGGGGGGGGIVEAGRGAMEGGGALVRRCYRGVCRVVSVGGGSGGIMGVGRGVAQRCYRGACRIVGGVAGLAGDSSARWSGGYAAHVGAANRVMRSGHGSYGSGGYGSSGSGSYGMRRGRY